MSDDGLPPAPGTAPIPEGHVRLFHYTGAPAEKVKSEGLLESYARGDGGLGAGNEPSAGVWASTRHSDDIGRRANYVEFHAPLHEISNRAEDPWREMSGLDEPGSFGKGHHHVIMKGDVKPKQIVAVHEPWHNHVRYMRDRDMVDEVKNGQYDHLKDDPDYGQAIEHIKRHGSRSGYWHVSPRTNRESIERHGLRPGEEGTWLFSERPEPSKNMDLWHVQPTGAVAHGSEQSAEWGPDDPVHVLHDHVPPERLRREAGGSLAGHKESWGPGETAHFEYHCYEGHDSSDAQAWYRSHQPVTVLHKNETDAPEDWAYGERQQEGMPHTYRVRFRDGHEHDAWEDELHTDPKHWYRPDPPPMPKQAGVLTDWKPTERLFAPTKGDVDPRLFTDHEMKPEVRTEILDLIDAFWIPKYGDWRSWARVYLAGSQASEWYGNNDFDLLLGVNYEAFRKATGKRGSNEEITAHFNREFQQQFNDEHWHPKFDSEHEWHRTGYVNANSYDIRAIKPYAAYDVGANDWAVDPIHEPTGHQFAGSEWYYMEGFAAKIKAAMALPEPHRTVLLKRLWRFLHADRSRAFGPHGTGAFDRGNATEKYLDQAGLWEPLMQAQYGKTAALVNSQDVAYRHGHEREAGKGKPRSVSRPDQDAQASPGQRQEGQGDQPRGDEAQAQPLVIKWHSGTDADMKRLDKPLKQKITDRVEELAANGGRHATTHPLKDILPGWHASRVNYLHRIVHQIDPDDGTLHIGYVGPHDYSKAVRRLGAVSWDAQNDDLCTACGGSGEQGTGHECYICDGSGDGAEERASRAAGITNDNPANGLPVGLDLAKGQRPKVAAIKLRCSDCGEDYFTDGEKHGCTEKTAAKHTVWDMSVRAQNRHHGGEARTILQGRMCEGHIAELNDELRKHNADPQQNTTLSIDHDTWPVDKSENPVCHTCVQRSVNDVFKSASADADHEVLYHLTDQHHFALNPEHSPHDNAFAIQDRSHYKGLYAVNDSWGINRWRQGEGYHRPYVAEIHVPKGLTRDERWGGEKFLPAEHFDQATVHRVVPVDQHERETYGVPKGSVEDYHGTPNPGEGKDVRDFTPAEHTGHLKRLREYLHDVHGWGWNEFNRKHEHVGVEETDDDGMEVRRDRQGKVMTTRRTSSRRMARVHHPEQGPDGEPADGIMIALVPPQRVIKKLPLPPDGEHPSNVHITLVYLGKVTDFTEEQVEYLPELIESWAETQRSLNATVQGVGTFANPGSHVLWAAADIPGGNHLWVSLADTLKSHGYAFKENHGWTPHLTMSYEKNHVRFLPKIERMEFKVREVWCCIGGRWESFPLRGR